ncbi:MAG: NusG domain II-containing protein [Clostridiaceae bacterium]|nr:NusG domain II-containing protein [Clostridiaceae bacterium]
MIKFAKKSDIIIIAAFISVGILLWIFFGGLFGGSNGLRAEIYYKSELIKTVDLTEGKEESFSVEGVPTVVFHLYTDGSIAFIKSDCPDQICVRSGRLRKVGQMAACLPNQLYMKIVGSAPGNSDEPDMIIG